MTYIQWRDELDRCLRGIPNDEREKVFSYFSEMYADKRDAGLSEREIIAEFGAPYDVAQRILNENRAYDDENGTVVEDNATLPTVPVRKTGRPTEQPDKSGRGEPSPIKTAPTKKKKGGALKMTLKIIISIVIILAVGAAVLFAVLSLKGWRWNPDFTTETFTSVNEATELDVAIAAGNAKIEFYEGDAVTVSYPVSNVFRYTVTESAGKITVSPKKFFWFFNTNRIPETVIKIPEDAAMDLQVDLSAGKISIAGGNYGDIYFYTSAGALQTGDINCKNMTCEISAGSATLGSIVCGNADVDLSAGSLSVAALTCNKADFDLSAGSVSIAKITCPVIDVDLSAGSLKMTVKGNVNDYTVFVDKSAGSCNLTNSTGTLAGYTITIDLSAGSVTVNFTD